MRGRFTRLGAAILAGIVIHQAKPASATIAPDIVAAFTDYALAIPTSERLTFCHGFGCALRTVVDFSAADRAKLTQLLGSGRASPAAERNAVAAAVAWLDRRVGPLAGTAGHGARADWHNAGPGQLDCIDTSRNTTGLLLVLDEMGLLRHHEVEAPQARGVLVDGRLPHATAVLRERVKGVAWSVDAWTRAYGQPAEVMMLEHWLGEGY